MTEVTTSTPTDVVQAAVVERENRFVLRARLASGEDVRAYLPNTARLTDLLRPGRPILLKANNDPGRRTAYTVHRVWHGETLVAIAATAVNDLVEDWLIRCGRLPDVGRVIGWDREVTVGGHRLDFRLELTDGHSALLEVKSLSLAFDGLACFSRTPSTRGVRHLELLAQKARQGGTTACGFVVQRPDARALAVDVEADAAWLQAVRAAAASGVSILAFACRVTTADVEIAAEIPVHLGESRA